MPDTQELQVRISVIDDGSVDKIRSIQDALAKFPGVQAPQHVKKFKEESKDLFETLLKGFESINQGPAAMGRFTASMAPAIASLGGFALRLGAIGTATAVAVKEMNELSREMIELGNISKQTGIAVGDVHSILEQFSEQGIKDGAAALQGLSAAMENLARVNSPLHRQLLISAGAFKPAMQGFIESLATAESAEQRINRIWQATQNVQANAFAELRRRGFSEDAARGCRRPRCPVCHRDG